MASSPREDRGWAIAFLTVGIAILATGFLVAYRHDDTGTMISTSLAALVVLGVCPRIVKEYAHAKKKKARSILAKYTEAKKKKARSALTG